MRVLYDYQTFSKPGYSGIPRYFIELAARIAGFAGVEARIVSPIILSPMLADHRNRMPTFGIDLSRLPIPARIVRAVNQPLFRSYAALARPDIVHETYYRRDRTAPNGSKIVMTFHDAIPQRVPHLFPHSEATRAGRQQVLHRADHLICVSQSTRNDLLDLFDVDPARVSVILLGSSLSPSPGGPIDIGSPYLLHVGQRHAYKNFNALIRAFGETGLHRTHKLVSFSSTPWTEGELREAQLSGVPESAMLRTSGDDQLLARYYSGAVALVFPSFYEGFGIPLLEAMRCGCPIVTSNVSSMPEVAGDAALYVTPGDGGSLMETLVRVSSSFEIRERLTASGLARAKGLSWERCAAETYEVYRNVLARD